MAIKIQIPTSSCIGRTNEDIHRIAKEHAFAQEKDTQPVDYLVTETRRDRQFVTVELRALGAPLPLELLQPAPNKHAVTQEAPPPLSPQAPLPQEKTPRPNTFEVLIPQARLSELGSDQELIQVLSAQLQRNHPTTKFVDLSKLTSANVIQTKRSSDNSATSDGLAIFTLTNVRIEENPPSREQREPPPLPPNAFLDDATHGSAGSSLRAWSDDSSADFHDFFASPTRECNMKSPGAGEKSGWRKITVLSDAALIKQAETIPAKLSESDITTEPKPRRNFFGWCFRRPVDEPNHRSDVSQTPSPRLKPLDADSPHPVRTHQHTLDSYIEFCESPHFENPKVLNYAPFCQNNQQDPEDDESKRLYLHYRHGADKSGPRLLHRQGKVDPHRAVQLGLVSMELITQEGYIPAIELTKMHLKQAMFYATAILKHRGCVYDPSGLAQLLKEPIEFSHSWERNRAWLLGAIHGGHPFIQAGKLTNTSIRRSHHPKEPSALLKEVKCLDGLGYSFHHQHTHSVELIHWQPPANSQLHITLQTLDTLSPQAIPQKLELRDPEGFEKTNSNSEENERLKLVMNKRVVPFFSPEVSAAPLVQEDQEREGA